MRLPYSHQYIVVKEHAHIVIVSVFETAFVDAYYKQSFANQSKNRRPALALQSANTMLDLSLVKIDTGNPEGKYIFLYLEAAQL